jgi:hypothetical protein
MADYYQKRPRAQVESTIADPTNDLEGSKALSSEFDLYRQRLVDTDDEGWASELRRYLNDRPANVTKHTDIVTWWQVSRLIITQIPQLIVTGRIMLYYIRHLRVSPLTFSHVRPLQYRASVYSQQVSSPRMIVELLWARNDLRSFRL